jgi:ribosomal protein L29
MEETTPEESKPQMTNEELQKKLEEIANKPFDYRGGHPTMTAEQSKARLRELILYIADQSKDDPHFTIEKLSDLLYIIDTEFYKKTGQSLTGSIYIKKEDDHV